MTDLPPNYIVGLHILGPGELAEDHFVSLHHNLLLLDVVLSQDAEHVRHLPPPSPPPPAPGEAAAAAPASFFPCRLALFLLLRRRRRREPTAAALAAVLAYDSSWGSRHPGRRGPRAIRQGPAAGCPRRTPDCAPPALQGRHQGEPRPPRNTPLPDSHSARGRMPARNSERRDTAHTYGARTGNIAWRTRTDTYLPPSRRARG